MCVYGGSGRESRGALGSGFGVGVKELWSDEGSIVQGLLGLCGCGMKSIIVFFQVIHVLKWWSDLFSAWTGGHASSLHAVRFHITWLK